MLLVGFATGVLAATVGFALVAGDRAAGGGDGPLELQLAHSLTEDHAVHLAMVYMAERLADKSDGTLTLKISPNGQLGGETECLSLVQRGRIAMTKVSTAPLENFVPEAAIFGVPYLFQDEDHYWRVLSSPLGQQLLAAGQDAGLWGLCYYDAGARSFYTVDRPILNPNDLKGMLIRVQESPTSIAMVEALGGSPTPVDFGELYTALQQGVVDGAENNPPSFYKNRHYEVCKQYSLDEHTRSPDVLLISTKWWGRLNPQQQAWLQEAAEESAEHQRELWREQTAESLAGAEAEGVQIHRPDLAPFRAAVEQMIDSYDGTPVGELIDRIQAMGEGA